MKTCFVCLIQFLMLAALVPAARGSVINYAGAQTDLGSGWRTSSVPKPLDIDGDSVLGTDGYDMINRPPVPPGYVDSMAILTPTYPGNGDYALIDDPTNLPALFTTGTMNPFPGSGLSANIFQFTLNAGAEGRTIRVGLMVDNLDLAYYNAIGLSLAQTSGVGTTNGPVATTAPVYNDSIPDWIFFDITGAVAGDTFAVQGVGGEGGAARLGGVSFDSVPAPATHSVYALNFNGSDNYVSVSLSSPPTNNYTLSAWIYLRTGGTVNYTRMAVLGGTGCGDSVEFTVHARTDAPTDPQYLELGRCGFFNGDFSTNPVPLDAWVNVAVTVDSSQVVSYYINGDSAGSWTNAEDDFSFGPTVNLADNNGYRAFDGQLTDVQIWNRVLSQSEIQTYMNRQPAGSESGLYAFYPFNEGSGGSTADFAAAGGGSTGALIENPLWAPLALVVTNNADNGPGTLRDVLAIPFPGSTINFDPSLAGATILLTNGEIELTNNGLTIDASALAGGVAIDGDTNSRIFYIASGAFVELVGLTITNGYATNDAGGGIVNAGTLTLNQVIVVGNTSTYEGGGIENDGPLTVLNSTIYNNFGGYGGGGIDNSSPLTVIQSTIFGNSIPAGDGSGIWAGGSNFLINCTVVGNSGPPGQSGIAQYGPAPIIMTNCVVALNTPNNVGGVFTGSNDITNGDPLLSPLGDYGGPTPTLPPQAGSPALDAGSDVVTNFLTTDQRGLARLSGAHVDIGAVESQVVQVTTNADSGPGSLRHAVITATDGSVITFAANLSGQTITLTNGAITVRGNVGVDGTGLPGGITVSGNLASGIFNVSNAVAVSFAGLTLTNGSQYDGGAIYVAATGAATVSRCALVGNDAVEGGAVCNDGPVVLNECTLAGNYASYGGAMECRAPTTITQCTISSNTGYYGGGGLWIVDPQVGVNNSIIAGNNEADGTGLDLDMFNVNGVVAYCNANIVQFFDAAGGSLPPTGPAPIPAAPLLAPLGNYGGPTPAMLPLPASPAVDAGGYSVLTEFLVDQRGYPRLSGPQVDIGAVELQQAVAATLGASPPTASADLVSGSVTPNDLATTWYFEYGTSTDYGAYSITNPLPAGFSPDNVNSTLAGLTPGATYHYQLLAYDGVSVKTGGDAMFTTLAIGTAPLLGGAMNLGADGVQFAFTNQPGASFTVYATTNLDLLLAQWTQLGIATELPAGSGLYHFTDPQATNHLHRFYVVHSP